MTRRTQLLLGLLGLLPCLACFSPSEGDRTTTGTCPEGETCSASTPGLFFVGTLDVGDGGRRHVGVVAVHGTERVQLLAGGAIETATPFTTTVDVVSDTPAVLAVDANAGGTVTIRGVSEGTASLRVLEHGTTTLIDRVDVTVLDAPDVTLRAIALDPGTDVLSGRTAEPFAMFAGAHVDLGVALASIDVVVDTSLSVTDATGRQLVSGSDGAPYRFAVDASTARPATFHLRAAGRDATVDVPVVTQIDDIRLRDTLVGTTRRLCATARASGRAVVGAPAPSFAAEGDVTLGAQDGACIDFVPGRTPGATISATISGVTRGTGISA